MDPIYTEKFKICQKFMFDPTLEHVAYPPHFPNGRDLEKVMRDLEKVVLIPLSETHDLRKVLAKIKAKVGLNLLENSINRLLIRVV